MRFGNKSGALWRSNLIIGTRYNIWAVIVCLNIKPACPCGTKMGHWTQSTVHSLWPCEICNMRKQNKNFELEKLVSICQKEMQWLAFFLGMWRIWEKNLEQITPSPMLGAAVSVTMTRVMVVDAVNLCHKYSSNVSLKFVKSHFPVTTNVRVIFPHISKLGIRKGWCRTNF